MKVLLLLALLAAPAAATAPGALVWIPSESFKRWSEVDALLRERSSLRLTIALTPAMVTPLTRSALGPWIEEGRVEVAVRLPGDPILPLVASHPSAPRPQDALERFSDTREALKVRLGTAPVGFVTAAGAVDPALVAPLSAAGADWVLVGPYAAADGPWAASGRTTFVPARAADADAPAAFAAPGATVYDESVSTGPALAQILREAGKPDEGWATIGGLLKTQLEPLVAASEAAAWPAWDEDAAALPAEEPGRAAWDAYGEAARALERYQNSGAAGLNTLDAAVALLRQAQSGAHFRAEGVPPAMRSKLLAMYRRLKLPAPESLYEAAPGEESANAADDLPTGVRAVEGASWVSFNNPAGSSGAAPEGAASTAPWTLLGLRVQWDENEVRFVLRARAAEAKPAAPLPVFDVYMDLNRVLGAGQVQMLEGRGAFLQARDAWEYALSWTAGASARLYRSGPGEPQELTEVAATADPAKGTWTIIVPRAILRGNPARWGYAAISLAEDPARPGRSPAAPLVATNGVIVAGMLAPLDVQRATLGKPGALMRIPAARLAK